MNQTLQLDQTFKAHVGFSTDVLSSLAQKALESLNPKLLQLPLTLSLVWVDDQEIKKINKKFRKIDSATDVLSFSYLDELDKNDRQLGEIMISVNTLQQQAKDWQHAEEEEAKILFVHGLLHILGYDHEESADKLEMKQLETNLLGDNSGLVGRSMLSKKMIQNN